MGSFEELLKLNPKKVKKIEVLPAGSPTHD